MEQLNRLICIIVSITLFSQLTNAGIQNEGDSAGIQNQEDNGAKTLTIEKLDKDTLSNKENEPAKKETAPFLINVKNTMNSKPIKIITRGSKAVGNGIRQFGSNVADRLNENHRKYSIEVSPKSKVPAAIRHNLIEPTVAASQVTAEKTKKFYESKLGKNGKSEASSSSSSSSEEEEEEEKKKGEEGEKKSKKKEKKHKEYEKNDEEQEKKSKKKEKNGEEELIKKEEEISKKPKITVGGISSTARDYGTALKRATGSTVNKVYGKIKGDGTKNDSEDTADPTLNEKKMKEKKEKKEKKKRKKGKKGGKEGKEGKENKEKKEKKKQRKDEVSGEAV